MTHYTTIPTRHSKGRVDAWAGGNGRMSVWQRERMRGPIASDRPSLLHRIIGRFAR